MNGGEQLIPLLQGMALGAGICLTLGPQSAFVLRQGIRGEAAFTVAAICTFADLLLIAAATIGVHAIIGQFPGMSSISAWGGAAFAAAFGFVALSRAARSGRAPAQETPFARTNYGGAIAAALALSLLNPQTYVEMLMLVGSSAMRFSPGDRVTFSVGVALISPLWFFGLVAGGRRLAFLFIKPRALGALDLIAGLAMLALATTIVIGELSNSVDLSVLALNWAEIELS